VIGAIGKLLLFLSFFFFFALFSFSLNEGWSVVTVVVVELLGRIYVEADLTPLSSPVSRPINLTNGYNRPRGTLVAGRNRDATTSGM
jgi:hypothetical protein